MKNVEYRLYEPNLFSLPKGVLDRRVGALDTGWPKWPLGTPMIIIDRRARCWLWKFKMGFFVVLKGKVEAETFEEAELIIRNNMRQRLEELGI